MDTNKDMTNDDQIETTTSVRQQDRVRKTTETRSMLRINQQMEVLDSLPLVALGSTWGTEERYRAPEKPVHQHDCLGGALSHLSDQ